MIAPWGKPVDGTSIVRGRNRGGGGNARAIDNPPWLTDSVIVRSTGRQPFFHRLNCPSADR